MSKSFKMWVGYLQCLPWRILRDTCQVPEMVGVGGAEWGGDGGGERRRGRTKEVGGKWEGTDGVGRGGGGRAGRQTRERGGRGDRAGGAREEKRGGQREGQTKSKRVWDQRRWRKMGVGGTGCAGVCVSQDTIRKTPALFLVITKRVAFLYHSCTFVGVALLYHWCSIVVPFV